jgi:3-oxoadipyl-CoA thiolase
MRHAVIVDGFRTPIGRYGGVLKDLRPDDMAAWVIRALVERTNVNPASIEDVVFGASNQAGEDNRNVARMAALLAGLPPSVAGQTVNRLCGSGLQAIITAAHAIQAGAGEVFVAGGVESMTRAPFVMAKSESAFARGNVNLVDTTLGWRFINPALATVYHPYSMGETAENVAERWGIDRAQQDAFAARSQARAIAAIQSGRFDDEIVPVTIPNPRSGQEVVSADEHPRADTTIEKLSALKPAFKSNGSVTAGNSSGINDGASALLVMSEAHARAHHFKPMARIIGSAVVGVEPAVMGIGPVEATRKALARAGLALADIDLIELNEAFAAQALACIQALQLDIDKVNVNGGGIALGHPLGSSGARIAVTLVHEMKRRKARYGLATMCIGVGQGIAAVFERLDA